MSDRVTVRRALLSVSDKTGLVPFATALANVFGVELISTGGTAKTLRDAGLTVRDVSEITGFPEMMDGRVKTLHPNVHGGLLAIRDDAGHSASMREHGIAAIDLVVVNLYPFAATIAKPDCTFEHAIENIDIGGPSMIRSAAKNHRYVTVVTSPEWYDKALADLRENDGATSATFRRRMALDAFQTTSEYDDQIHRYFANFARKTDLAATHWDLEPHMIGEPDGLHVPLLNLRKKLRYGENPHQSAALYVARGPDQIAPSLTNATQLHGKELSYINLLDADAALACVRDFAGPAACIVKHATPCGVATSVELATAFAHAYDADPLAAFGGIVALNRDVDLATARAIVDGQKFLEVIVAPTYADEALALLRDRWKNVRLLALRGTGVPPMTDAERPPHGRDARATRSVSIRSIDGGFLVQSVDDGGVSDAAWRVVSVRKPTESELADLRFAWLACKHVKSNAIVLAKNGATVGIGGGQVDRVGAARIAIEKAGERARGSVVASDAFFPFPDGPALLLAAGVTAIVQPGGSQRDQLTIDAVNASGAAMIFTGERHFRH